jgi:16S rRNA (adenine1518-N6/adenine1519-N6)-dimethyltransferase
MPIDMVVVDEQDKVIGQAPRQDGRNLPEGMLYRVSALWITNSAGKSLLARRALTKKHYPGRWGPGAAGTVEIGETYESNILKELEEELGVTNVPVKKGPKFKTIQTYVHFTQYFTCTIDKAENAFVLQEEEVAEVKWFSAEELLILVQKDPEQFTESTRTYIVQFL